METRNVLLAVILSTIVLVFWATFFEAPIVDQTNNEKLVRYGLDLSQAQNPVDSLIPLLRQVWLEQTPVADHNATMHDPEIETIQ